MCNVFEEARAEIPGTWSVVSGDISHTPPVRGVFFFIGGRLVWAGASNSL